MRRHAGVQAHGHWYGQTNRARPSPSSAPLHRHGCSQRAIHRFRLPGEGTRSSCRHYGQGKERTVVAGTGLYLTSLIDELSFPGEWPEIRRELQQEPEVSRLYRQLKELDPEAASKIERSNRRRIERALEVCIGSGKPFSATGPGTGAYPDNGVVQIGLLWPREMLVARVEQRVHNMMAAGFLDEVQQLRKDGNMSHTAKQALGYAELLRHLEGKCTLEQAVGDIVIHTRQFAVRQERWFRRDPRITWVNIERDPVSEIGSVLAKHLN